jgi:hypothetical protein
MNRKSDVTVTKVAQAACDMYFIGVVIMDLCFGTLICDQSYEDGTQGFVVIPLEERTPRLKENADPFILWNPGEALALRSVKPITNGRMTKRSSFPR